MINHSYQAEADNAGSGRQTAPRRQLIEQLNLMVRARYPLLYMVAVEEEPVEEMLIQLAAQFQPQRQVLLWDIVRGWSDNSSDKGSIMGALNRITKTATEEAIIFVLRDLHPILKSPGSDKNAPVVRELKNLARELKRSRKTLATGFWLKHLPGAADFGLCSSRGALPGNFRA